MSNAMIVRTTEMTRWQRLIAPLVVRYLRWQLRDTDLYAFQLENALRQHRYKAQELQAELILWEGA